jgi:Spy/CpxP family protein refolding chaperone
MLHQGGYTDLVVYLAQQITQFNLRGEEFAMKHLGAEDEMKQALRDLMASWPLEQRLAGVSLEKRLEGLSPRERLKGLSPEELLEGLTPEDRQRLRQLLQQQPSEDDSSAGK